MSYENKDCVCGDKKPAGTMLCTGCEQAFSNLPEMRTFKDTLASDEVRRPAAIRLLSLARRRNSLFYRR